MPTYNDALVRIEAASKTAWNLPLYQGGLSDFAALKQYVWARLTEQYGALNSADFNQATLYSTTILRDFVHRALYQSTTHQDMEGYWLANKLTPAPRFQDIGSMFRQEATGLCGDLAWQAYNVFRAFGYDTTYINTVNGEVSQGNPSQNPYAFDNGHVTTEVRLSDLGKWIVQDATFNFLVRASTNSTPLSLLEVRTERYINGNASLTIDHAGIYTWFRFPGQYYEKELQQYPPEYPVDFINKHLAEVIWTWRSRVGGTEVVGNITGEFQTVRHFVVSAADSFA
jgi:hypothetical protein